MSSWSSTRWLRLSNHVPVLLATRPETFVRLRGLILTLRSGEQELGATGRMGGRVRGWDNSVARFTHHHAIDRQECVGRMVAPCSSLVSQGQHPVDELMVVHTSNPTYPTILLDLGFTAEPGGNTPLPGLFVLLAIGQQPCCQRSGLCRVHVFDSDPSEGLGNLDLNRCQAEATLKKVGGHRQALDA